MNSSVIWVMRWLPAILWMGMIFLFSHQAGDGSGTLSRIVMNHLAKVGIDFQAWFGAHAVWVMRKCAHFIAYMILFFLLLLAISGGSDWRRLRWQAWSGVVIYACMDEFHQWFVPGRVAGLADVVIDCCGGLTGLLLSHLGAWFRKWPGNTPQAPVS
ncbi:MAG: hypothetical protein RLZZ165_2150 [Bacteroidota bacterium]|jgi:VanZ family protein